MRHKFVVSTEQVDGDAWLVIVRARLNGRPYRKTYARVVTSDVDVSNFIAESTDVFIQNDCHPWDCKCEKHA